jgi:hypothetical protein
MKILTKSMVLVFIFVMFSFFKESHAGDVGNGGDTVAQEFTGLGRRLLHLLQMDPAKYPEVNITAFEQTLDTIQVHSSKEPLLLSGVLKDAISDSKKNLILVDQERWDSFSANGTQGRYRQMTLVFHELLCILGLEETDKYPISGRLQEKLASLPSGDGDIIQIETSQGGGGFSCALFTAGKVKCWGYNIYGNLGIGTIDPIQSPLIYHPLPEEVLGVQDAQEISVGSTHACALLLNGQIRCWGNNSKGQLGANLPATYTPHPLNTQFYYPVPEEVYNVNDGRQISSAGDLSCVLRANGKVRCWGNNWYNALGNEELLCQGPNYQYCGSNIPIQVSGITDALQIITVDDNGNQGGCVLRTSGTVTCWGANYKLLLNVPYEQIQMSAVPLDISGLVNVATISRQSPAGSGARARLLDGTSMCWADGKLLHACKQ